MNQIAIRPYNTAKITLLLLSVAIISLILTKQFFLPIWFKNVPVFVILFLSAYTAWQLSNTLSAKLRLNLIVKEISGFAVILAGTFMGTFIINWLNISHFGAGDIKDTLLIAFLFNAVRSIIHLNFVRAKALVQQKETEIAIAKAASTKAQLESLSSQINPHFLYNSLNAIAGLALVDGGKTMRMTVALSKLLRYNLDHAARNLATVREEIEVIKTYLEIEKIRFGDGLNYIMDVSEESTPFLIPRFLLQPLVENSIKHAFHHSEHPICIKIIISVTNGNLIIAIHDNGNPFPETIVPGHGMKNVSDRLQLLFPDKYDMQISNLPQKAITVRLLKR
jgi:hypothetical protein